MTEQNEECEYQDVPQADPFKHLPKSSMNLAQCKNDYFTSKEAGEKYFEEKFWAQYDPTGFSIHHGKYKYNDEFGPLAFIRRNVVTGIVQSMDSTIAHKNLFGVFRLYTNKQLECVFITRSDSMNKECVGDMVDSFDWYVLNIDTDRNLIMDFFSVEENDSIEFFTRFV